MTERARALQTQILDSGHRFKADWKPHVEENIESIMKVIKSDASATWNSGNIILGTDAVILEQSLCTNYWSVCHKDDYDFARKLSFPLIPPIETL